MMNRLLLFVLSLSCCLAGAVPVFAQGTSADQPASTADAPAAPVDFAKLRHDYGWRDDFEQQCVINRPLQAAALAMTQHDLDKVQELAGGWLQHCPVDIDMRIILASTLRHAGKAAEADVHAKFAWGLLKSVLESGDGKSQKTAYVTISVNEEYSVLNMMHLKRGKQALLMDPPCDMLTVTNANGQELTLYFNTELDFARMQKQMGGSKATPTTPTKP